MSLRILFADDSMTAQNMGKKILSEAGYDVVAVSNGAAAVKKIAEQKPDIIILDVYMPGYSGLEVCEKIRGSLDTLKTPVLLTVGKMEPYKPEDANRVKADGVIIKPFEASDLLAIVKKFEERIAQVVPVPPIVEQTVRLERQYHEEAITAPELPMEHHSTGKTGVQPMVEVPDHMASSAAFTDMLGGDLQSAPQHFAVNTPAAAFETSVIVPAPPVPATDYDLPVSWKKEEEEPAEPIAAMPAEAEHEIVATPAAAPEPAEEIAAPEPQASTMSVGETLEHEPSHPQFIPVFKEPEPEPAAATSYEVMPTSAPPMPDMDIPREPALQETADIATRNTVVDRVEPGLLSTIEQQMETRVDTPAETAAVSSADENSVSAAGEETPAPAMEVAPAESYSAPLPRINATSEVNDSDFEARVAAAMAAYSHAAESTSASSSQSHVAVAESPVSTAAAAPAPIVDEVPAAEAPHAAVEHVPSFEYQPPVRVPEPEPVEQAASVAEIAAEPESVPAPSATEPVAAEPAAAEPAAIHDALTSGVEAAAVAAAAKTGEEHHTIAQAVHRVMERLKPELVEEIMRELKSKK